MLSRRSPQPPPSLVEGETIGIRGAPPWLTTYADLMTQILIFFVAFFALTPVMEEAQIHQVKKKLQKFLTEKGYSEMVDVTLNEKGLVLSLKSEYMFDPGSADLKPRAKRVLSDIIEFLKLVPNKIRIEGHTDNLPLVGRIREKFPTNWELSDARATNILRYFVEEKNFPPYRVSGAGFAEWQPKVTLAEAIKWVDSNIPKLKKYKYKFLAILSRTLEVKANNTKKLLDKKKDEILKFLIVPEYGYNEGGWMEILRGSLYKEIGRKKADKLLDSLRVIELKLLNDFNNERYRELVKKMNLNEDLRKFNRRVEIVIERFGTPILRGTRATLLKGIAVYREKVNVNLAGMDELKDLPGFNEKIASEIINYRDGENHLFKSPEDIAKAIKESALRDSVEKLCKTVLAPILTTKLNLNEAKEEDISHLIFKAKEAKVITGYGTIESRLSETIVALRKEIGGFEDLKQIENLLKERGEKELAKAFNDLRPYFCVE